MTGIKSKLAAAAVTVAALAAPVALAAPAQAAPSRVSCTGWSQVSNTAVYMRACTRVSGKVGEVAVDVRNVGAKTRKVGMAIAPKMYGASGKEFVKRVYVKPGQRYGYSVVRASKPLHGGVGGRVLVEVHGGNGVKYKAMTAPTLRF